MRNLRISRRLAWIGVPLVLLIALVAFWNWDWFIPIVQSRASAAIGRPVTIAHLHLRLGRVVTVTADGVVVANPPDWPNGDPPFVSIKSLTIQADAWGYVRGNGLVIPVIEIDGPRVLAAETKDGAANFRLSTGGGSSGSLKIGAVRITDGDAHVVIPPLKSDFNAKIETQGDGDAAKLVVDAKGTYAAQPITAHLVGGALLSLRDAKNPWPVELNVENGPTHVSLDGTLQDPVAFQGADVRLKFSGPDMGLLEPLVGFPIPKTPAYQLAGKLDVDGLDKIRFTDFQGRLGNSDIAGTIEVQPSGTEVKGKTKPVVTMNLRSNRVDLADLNGFIGGTPARSNTANATPEQREAAARANARSEVVACYADQRAAVRLGGYSPALSRCAHLGPKHAAGRPDCRPRCGGRADHPASDQLWRGQRATDRQCRSDARVRQERACKDRFAHAQSGCLADDGGDPYVRGRWLSQRRRSDRRDRRLVGVAAGEWQRRGQDGDGRRGFVRGAG